MSTDPIRITVKGANRKSIVHTHKRTTKKSQLPTTTTLDQFSLSNPLFSIYEEMTKKPQFTQVQRRADSTTSDPLHNLGCQAVLI